MNRLRILYIDPIGPVGHLGGSHISLLDLMHGMRMRGHDVLLACPYKHILTDRAEEKGIPVVFFHMIKPLETRIVWRGHRLFNWPVAAIDLLFYIPAVISLYWVIRRYRPDIVHCNNTLFSIAVGLSARFSGVPCVWHLRAIPSLSVPRFAIQVYAILASLLADQIIANSKATAEFLKDLPAYNKITLVYNGIDIRSFQAVSEVDSTQVRKKLNIPASAHIVANFSRVIPMKGHTVLLEALHKIVTRRETYLLVIGGYDERDQYFVSLMSLLTRLGLSSRVKFIDFQSDIRPYLISADVVVACSTEAETFGRTLVEAMAAGKPVVATCVGAHPEVIEDGITGFLVAPNSAQQLADSIVKILKSKQLASDMGRAGQARVMSLFDLDTSFSRLETIYYNLVHNRVEP